MAHPRSRSRSSLIFFACQRHARRACTHQQHAIQQCRSTVQNSAKQATRPRGALVAAVTSRAEAVASGREDLSLSDNGQRRGEARRGRIASGKGCRSAGRRKRTLTRRQLTAPRKRGGPVGFPGAAQEKQPQNGVRVPDGPHPIGVERPHVCQHSAVSSMGKVENSKENNGDLLQKNSAHINR